MSKDKIADYDGTTAGNNTDIGGISIDRHRRHLHCGGHAPQRRQ
jgi:hypothetical protein